MLGKSRAQILADGRASLISKASPLLIDPGEWRDWDIPPYALGLPDRYQDWREAQKMATLAASYSEKRFVFQCAPTGFGKSLAYMANSKLETGRTIILTSTKGLQDQLTGDFGESGLRAVKGKNAYECIEAPGQGWAKGTSVADGPCHVGYECPNRGPCLYFRALREAQTAACVVANYASWMYIQATGDSSRGEDPPLGNFDLMVCDEAHDAPEWVSKYLECEITQSDFTLLGSTPVQSGCTIEDWIEWARYWQPKVEKRIKEGQKGLHGSGTTGARKHRELNSLNRKLLLMAGMRRDDWVMEDVWEGEGMKKGRVRITRFAPIDPSRYAEKVLFKGIKKVVLYSATVRPKTADLLGIKDDEYEFNEYPSTFPLRNRPITHIPTIRLSYNSSAADMAVWLSRIDSIISGRLDRKGLVHTVSFKRRNYIVENSRHGGSRTYVTNDSRNTRDVVQEFRRSGPGKVLISPSMTTGWDFPYDQCEYQIIGKIMFPDSSKGIMRERAARDKDLTNYIASQTLVQATGRGMRAEDDQCETFIIDDNIGWFVSSCKRSGFLPQWWLDALTTNQLIPTPPPPLRPRMKLANGDVDELWEGLEEVPVT